MLTEMFDHLQEENSYRENSNGPQQAAVPRDILTIEASNSTVTNLIITQTVQNVM